MSTDTTDRIERALQYLADVVDGNQPADAVRVSAARALVARDSRDAAGLQPSDASDPNRVVRLEIATRPETADERDDPTAPTRIGWSLAQEEKSLAQMREDALPDA